MSDQRSPVVTSARASRPTLGRREIAFLAVGAFNAGLGLAAFAVIYHLFGGTLGYLGSLVAAYAIAIGCAFVLHRRFVFKVRGQWFLDLTRFTLVQMTSLALNAVVLSLLVEVVSLPVILAQVISLGVVVVFAYFGHLLFSFRRSHRAEPTAASPIRT